MNATALIREHALRLGFDDCRVTTANPPARGSQLRDWLADGRHGTMTWLERNAAKRLDPPLVLSEARSIVTLAVSYHRSEVTSQHPANTAGLIARYARYPDYHDLLKTPLKELTEHVDAIGGPDTRSLWYVDTGPLLERELAERAGIGFVGKHTNLISRRLGNWFFLAEIITTAELPPDASEHNRCGNCTRCITACPTRAITAPFQLDARKCISYLTIELKGSIPEEHRRAIGNRVYGCDDCLEACPWNRFAREGAIMRNHARNDLDEPGLLELLALDNAAFKLRFQGTPMLRTKRRGVLRNVCVALGNVGTREALPALERASHDEEPLIAEHAAWAVAEIERRTSRSSA